MMSNPLQAKPKTQIKIVSFFTAALTFLFSLSINAQQISELPLSIGNNVAPNLILTMDDSASMGFGDLPGLNFDDRSRANYRSSHYNKIYYNPNITYLPPLNPDGSSYPDADFNNATLGYYQPNWVKLQVNLNNNFLAFQTWSSWGRGLINESYLQYGCPTNLCTPQRAYYYNFEPSNANCTAVVADQDWDDDCYTRVDVTDPDEKQNFANWYQYYSTRGAAAKTAMLRVFTEENLDGSIRIGRQSINAYKAIQSGPASSSWRIL